MKDQLRTYEGHSDSLHKCVSHFKQKMDAMADEMPAFKDMSEGGRHLVAMYEIVEKLAERSVAQDKLLFALIDRLDLTRPHMSEGKNGGISLNKSLAAMDSDHIR